jgi:predicted GNAT superfamily acetyltransferase
LVQVPADIEAIRQVDPDLAREWRVAVRRVLGQLLGGGARVTGFTRDGCYVVEGGRP